MGSTRARRSIMAAALFVIDLTILPSGEAFRNADAKGGSQLTIIDFAFQPDAQGIKGGRNVS